MVESGPAVAYARWCTARSNHKVPRYVKKQAKQFLDIVAGKDMEAHIDERAYARICNLLRIMVHPDIGKSLYDSLEDYAWLLITAVFCVKDNENRRYYNTAVLEIARKNFKTFNAAIIFILLMLTEPQFSRFFSVAPDLKLSSELKLAIRKIIKSSPLLADDGVFRVLRSEIRCKLTDSEYKLKQTVTGDTTMGVMREIIIESSSRAESIAAANEMIRKNALKRNATVTNVGNAECISGNAVFVYEPFTGLYGKFYIASDMHTWKNGLYTNKLTLAWKATIDAKAAGEAISKGNNKKKTQSEPWDYLYGSNMKQGK